MTLASGVTSGVSEAELDAIADRLIAAQDTATTLPPITASRPDFDVASAYAVLARIEAKRQAQGWRAAGRKIGFTNRTIWARYGVFRSMWAHVWTHTVHRCETNRASLSLARLVQPRIEPEVVFGLSGPVDGERGARDVLAAVEWTAPGFEIVQSHFPDWRFTAADCTAAFGLHGALVVGAPTPLDDAGRDALAVALPTFELTLFRGDEAVDRGQGGHVLDSPALALGHLAQVLATQPQFPPLAAGELVTTGTITDAWPVRAGETWRSDYGALGLQGLELRFT